MKFIVGLSQILKARLFVLKLLLKRWNQSCSGITSGSKFWFPQHIFFSQEAIAGLKCPKLINKVGILAHMGSHCFCLLFEFIILQDLLLGCYSANDFASLEYVLNYRRSNVNSSSCWTLTMFSVHNITNWASAALAMALTNLRWGVPCRAMHCPNFMLHLKV